MENQNPTGIEPATTNGSLPPKKQVLPARIQTFISKISAFVPPQVKALLAKFYANKKIFWPVTISFGILFLVLILGLLFGSPSQPIQSLVTPAPQVESTPEASPSGDVFSQTQSQLKTLDDQINALDLKQSRLSPPQLNYNISF